MKAAFLFVALLAPSAFAGSVYDHVNTNEFKEGVKASYLASVAGDAQRTKIIAAAQEECGGRYEGTQIEVTELKHVIDASDKRVIHTADPNNYSVVYNVTASLVWQVSETIQCSFHGGHNRSVLHARIMSGTEKASITYKYVNDNQVGDETVSAVSRAYSAHSLVLQYSYQTPYGTEIKP